MATGFLRVQTISRSAGRSATAAAAYRSASKFVDERTGELHDYSRKRGVESSHIIVPAGEDDMSSSELWNAAEQAETRKNSTVARELVVGLSQELSAEDRRETVLALAQEIADQHRCGIEVSIHEPRRLSQSEIEALEDPLAHTDFDSAGHPTNGNHHAHILMTTRRLEDGELTDKTREWDDLKTRVDCKERWSDRWVELQNAKFKERGMEARASRGEGDDIHLGPERAQLRRDENDAALEASGARRLHSEFFTAKREAEKPGAGEPEKLAYEQSRFYIENPEAALRELLEIKRQREPAPAPVMREIPLMKERDGDDPMARLKAMAAEREAMKRPAVPERTPLEKLLDERDARRKEDAAWRKEDERETFVSDWVSAHDLRGAIWEGQDAKTVERYKDSLREDVASLDRNPDYPDAIEQRAKIANDEPVPDALESKLAELWKDDEKRIEREEQKRLEREEEERKRREADRGWSR